MHAPKHWRLWVAWAMASLVLSGILAAGITLDDASGSAWRAAARTALLPGETTHGHYQIELQCNACHSASFADRDAMQDQCMQCHAGALEVARDSHPRTKFTDPRNADRARLLDAAYCVTCHVEHRPKLTHTAGVTLPLDFCVICHSEIGEERPSHQGMGFETCASAGCHNFHDNRALYGDFLVNNAEQPDLLRRAVIRDRNFRDMLEDMESYPIDRHPLVGLRAEDADGGNDLALNPEILDEWLATAHAAAGVNCSACHASETPKGDSHWVERPDHAACIGCHSAEVEGFLAARHGMRLAAGLPPMETSLARQPMRPDAHGLTLGCNTCHAAHRFETRDAGFEACLGCHDDAHTQAYEGSPHHLLWKRELAGELPPGSGVSCATCHLPRVLHRQDGVRRVLVDHNQNATLRPNEKMLRPVCMECHGLGFAIDALADPTLVSNNFRGQPQRHIESMEMALEAKRLADESRRQAREGREPGG